MLTHLEDTEVETHGRVLKPVHEEPERDGRFRPVRPYDGEPLPDRLVLRAFRHVEDLIAKHAPVEEIEAAQKALQDARDAAEESERLQAERIMMGREVARKNANDVAVKKARLGAAAAAKMRRQDKFVLVTSYGPIVVRAFPARADDVVIRQTVERSFSECAGWFSTLAEREIKVAAIKAAGGPAADLWGVPAICARLQHDLRVGLAHNCISISVGRES